MADALGGKAKLPSLFEKYNKENNKNYLIKEMTFPKASPYGWHNYPYDYYNIWVKHAGNEPYMEEPTLEMLTKAISGYNLSNIVTRLAIFRLIRIQLTSILITNLLQITSFNMQH